MDTKSLLVNLIADCLFSKKTCVQSPLSVETLDELFGLSAKHDMAHITASSLEMNGLVPQGYDFSGFKKQKLLSVYRYEQLNCEESRIYSLFDDNSVNYIPLKGSVIRNLYPEKWMRTSCDIDILIKKEDLEKSIELITSNLGYTEEGKHFHDYSLISPSGVHLELHFSLCENNSAMDKLLSKVWDYASPNTEQKNRFALTNEFLIFHIIAHAKTHFVDGGCGVRPLVDLYLLETKLKYDKTVLISLLKTAQCYEFYENLNKLISAWFENGEYTDLTKQMEAYILGGGVFGSRENFSASGQSREGKFKYFLSRLFLPKNKLELLYPSLKKRPFLMPFYQVKRWFRLCNGKLRKGIKEEFVNNARIGTVSEMFKQLNI